MATSTILLGMAIVLAHSSSMSLAECIIQNDGPGSYPWLIRIWLDKPVFEPTIAHGSLLSPTKVLSGAHIVDELDEKQIDLKSLGETTLAMTAYHGGCAQTQYAERVQIHWIFEDRKVAPYKFCQLGEFALLTPFRRFETVGGPFLISMPYDRAARDIESWMMGVKDLLASRDEVVKPANRQLENETSPETDTTIVGTTAGNVTEKPGTSGEVIVYMFADRDPNSSNIIPANKVPFMSWLQCVETENFRTIVGDNDLKAPGFTNFTFFCSDKIPGPKGTEKLQGRVGYDWHLGAPAVVELEHFWLAIGQYLFWTGESGIPFMFSTFTQYLFDFIEGKIPPPTPDHVTTTSSPITDTPTITKNPRSGSTGMIPTTSGGEQHRQFPIFIVIGLLASIFDL